MYAGLAVAVAGLFVAMPAMAQELTAEQARQFVAGKLFAYTCFEGTRGVGRINFDGSAIGTVQFQGTGKVFRARLPAHTLRIDGESVCATVKGLPFQPCFKVVKTNEHSFRGSLTGMTLAYCDFTRRYSRAEVIHRDKPLGIKSEVAAAAPR